MGSPEDLGRYRFKRLLGRGVLGEVWEAHDLDEVGSKVVVKIMHAPSEEFAFARILFAREARLASLVRHPNVATVLDAGEAAGTSFLVMALVEGTSLKLASADPSTPLDLRLGWLRQVAKGLSAMHRLGLAHRDLKPENVIVRPDGSACLVDLGLAKWMKPEPLFEVEPIDLDLDLDRGPVVTDFTPPEAAVLDEATYDELGDQYAWGVLARQLFTGSSKRDPAQPLRAVPGLSSAVADAVERAASVERSERFSSMEELLEALGHPAQPRPLDADSTMRLRKRAPRAWSVRPLVGLGLALVIAAGVALLALR
jgi:serine/threonine protein kinase